MIVYKINNKKRNIILIISVGFESHHRMTSLSLDMHSLLSLNFHTARIPRTRFLNQRKTCTVQRYWYSFLCPHHLKLVRTVKLSMNTGVWLLIATEFKVKVTLGKSQFCVHFHVLWTHFCIHLCILLIIVLHKAAF